MSITSEIATSSYRSLKTFAENVLAEMRQEDNRSTVFYGDQDKAILLLMDIMSNIADDEEAKANEIANMNFSDEIPF